MRLYVIRHPQPQVAADVCYGSSDVAVEPASLASLTDRLAAVLPAGLPMYSSPLQRCTALAVKLAGRLQCGPPVLDARLAELHFGAWELRPWSDIAHAEVNAWAADTAGYRPGGGETLIEMAKRVLAFRAKLLALGHDSIVVCHGGTMRLLLAGQHSQTPIQAAVWAAANPVSLPWGHVQVIDV